MKRIAILSDLHCGHVVGLTSPEYETEILTSGTSPTKFRLQRRKLWDWFDENIKKTKPFDIALINGDTIDGRGERSGGTELLTGDRSIQADMAASIIKRLGAKTVHMTQGTAYHSGQQEDWESIVAERCGAEIHDHFHGKIGDLAISMRHHVGNTASVPSRFTALSNAQIRQFLWAARKQQPEANLIIRSHIHACRYVGEPGSGWQAWVTPGLQGLGGKYGARAIDSLPIDFGFLVLTVRGQGDWQIDAHVAPLELQKAAIVKL